MDGAALWTPALLGTKLKMWLKGDDLAGSNGSTVATWTDASGNSNNATSGNATLVTSGLNGKNTVAFASPSSQFFTLPTGLVSSRTQSASFAVHKLNNSPPSGTNAGGAIFGDWGSQGLGNHEPYIDGNYYDGYLSSSRHTVSTVPTSTGWRILGLRSNASDWRLDMDATNYATDGTNTVGGGSAPLLGKTANAGANLYHDGQIAEIVDCNDFLTTSEKEKVEGYLAWKWGIQANLPVGHTYKSAAP